MVPYNPYLCLKYNAHINVEICSSVSSVKYLYKYVFKGHDRSAMYVQQGGAPSVDVAIDEVTNFVEGRYISSSEAGHRLFGFSMHKEFPNVYRLAVHLEGEHRVTWSANAAGQEGDNHGANQPGGAAAVRATVADVVSGGGKASTLMAWMQFNSQLPPGHVALSVPYSDFPSIASFQDKAREWKLLPEGRRPRGTVGRMYYVPPNQIDRFHLRLLLLHVPGATCWADIRTTNRGQPNQVVHPTFKEACIARGLLEDDAEWDRCMSEGIMVRALSCNDVDMLDGLTNPSFRTYNADGISRAAAADVCNHPCLQQCHRAQGIMGEIS